MFSPAEIPLVFLLASGIVLLAIGYFLGEIVQSIEDGLLLIAIRIAGYLVIGYLFLRLFFSVEPI